MYWPAGVPSSTKTPSMHDQTTILIVDDEEQLADLYGHWIDDDYETRIAYDGDEALELMDDDVDIVLLDRHMPGLSGDEVLHRFRDRGYDAWVSMVTAVDPEIGILDLPCNGYVVKPVSRYQLNRLVETVRIRTALNDQRQHVSLADKMETLESERDEETLRESDRYQHALETLRSMADTLNGTRRDDTNPEASENTV